MPQPSVTNRRMTQVRQTLQLRIIGLGLKGGVKIPDPLFFNQFLQLFLKLVRPHTPRGYLVQEDNFITVIITIKQGIIMHAL
eukprot:1352585-Amphidinium_carterae.1